MKRSFGVLLMALATLVVGASAALAQSTYPPEPAATSSTRGGVPVGGTPVGGTAFTGSDVSWMAIVAVTLLVAGIVALFVARRRSARSVVG
jgi:LPXTG-motif cell wall-anchored protein